MEYTLIAYRADFYDRCGDCESSYFDLRNHLSEEEMKNAIKKLNHDNTGSYGILEIIILHSGNIIYDEIDNREDYVAEEDNPIQYHLVNTIGEKVQSWREEAYQERVKAKEEEDTRRLEKLAAENLAKAERAKQLEFEKYKELKAKYEG